MSTIKKLTVVALAGALTLVGTAFAAGDFSPKMTFELSDTKVKANPELVIHVEQDDAEEELGSVTLRIPKGFKLPADEAIPGGETLGTGAITINAGPGCRPGMEAAPTIPLNLPASLEEQDRDDAQADEGVYAVWLLDISGVTTIPLEVTGSPKTGFQAVGEIAPNDNTCPPFTFDLTVNQQSSGGVAIITNPKKAGKYVMGGSLTSTDSPAVVEFKQPIKITK